MYWLSCNKLRAANCETSQNKLATYNSEVKSRNVQDGGADSKY